MAKTETTWWQYLLYCEATGHPKPESPGWGVNGDNPVTHVSWFDAVEYASWLSKREGVEQVITKANETYSINLNRLGYRLPTEVEWEYAARACMNFRYAGSDSLSLSAWYFNNSGNRTHPVSKKNSNVWGLSDMSGNVWEWCWDWYKNEYPVGPVKDYIGPISGGSRVIRGGAWTGYEPNCNISLRGNNSPYSQLNDLGFRLARR